MAKAPTQEEVLAYFDELSNWGRWGDEDELGTLNLITPEKRRQAASLVREGITVGCSKLIPWHGPLEEIRGAMPVSHMIKSGERYVLGLGDNPEHQSHQSAAESLTFVFHGGVFTHIDGLAHVFFDAKMYNGRSAGLVKTADGATAQSSEVMRDGILSRGILYDIPSLRGVDALEPGTAVSPEDLEEFEEAHGVRAEPGDILLLRTGYAGVVDALPSGGEPPQGRAGWGVGCLPWLRERGAALIGSDVINDAQPPGDYAETTLPVHQVGLVAMGLRLIDNAHLEKLAETCARLQRWEFCFTVNPLRLERGTGSPVNPIAAF